MKKTIISDDDILINYSIKRVSDIFLVFVHGLGGDLSVWNKEREFFHKKGYSTVAIDLRGHGLSDRPESYKSYKLEKFAEDIKEIIDEEDIKKFILIGHCFGGISSIMFHKLFPRFAKAYVLIDSTYKAPKTLKIFRHHPFFTQIVNHLLENDGLKKEHFSHVRFEKFTGTGDWNFLRIYSDITHTSLKSWLFTFENISRFNGIKTLKTIRQPVLVIEGKNDSIFDLKISNKIHKLARNSIIDVIPKGNHITPINNTKVLENMILRFLQEKIGISKPYT